ncbi:MAG: glycosyltransferase family 4 protein [Acidobacteria bacterium]|nr:glycosyltransferase family 4 protein [Acidobacteriota bacterium]
MTRRRLQEAFPRLGAGAVAIPLAVDPFFTPAPDSESSEPTRAAFAGGRRFILQLGTLEPRKGVATLIAAHASMLGRDPEAFDLVLAGARGWGGDFVARALAAHPDPARVHLPGYVSRDDARALLRHAEVVVMASEEEGFGLPLAEALACGARCVISDDEALVEVAGDAATVVPRGRADAFATAIAAVRGGAADCGRDRALARAAAFAPARHADAWRRVVEGMLSAGQA